MVQFIDSENRVEASMAKMTGERGIVVGWLL